MADTNQMFSRLLSLSLLLMQESSQEHSNEKCGYTCEGCWKQLMAKDLWTFAYNQYARTPMHTKSAKRTGGALPLKSSENIIKSERRYLDGLILSNMFLNPVYVQAR